MCGHKRRSAKKEVDLSSYRKSRLSAVKTETDKDRTLRARQHFHLTVSGLIQCNLFEISKFHDVTCPQLVMADSTVVNCRANCC